MISVIVEEGQISQVRYGFGNDFDADYLLNDISNLILCGYKVFESILLGKGDFDKKKTLEFFEVITKDVINTLEKEQENDD